MWRLSGTPVCDHQCGAAAPNANAIAISNVLGAMPPDRTYFIDTLSTGRVCEAARPGPSVGGTRAPGHVACVSCWVLAAVWQLSGCCLAAVRNPSETCLEPVWNLSQPQHPSGTSLEPVRNPSGTRLEPVWNPSGICPEPVWNLSQPEQTCLELAWNPHTHTPNAQQHGDSINEGAMAMNAPAELLPPAIFRWDCLQSLAAAWLHGANATVCDTPLAVAANEQAPAKPLL